jgi:integrase/recombinase XerD
MTVEDVIIEPVLWTYEPLKNGDFSIYLRLTYYKDVKYLGLGLSTSTIHWDSENFFPRPSHPNFRDILRKIDKLTDEVIFEIKQAEKEEREDLTLAEIKRNIKNKHRPAQDVPKTKMTLFELYNYLIDDYEDRGNTGYSDVFKSSRNSVQKIIKKDKPFELITEEDFYKYERYLSTKKTESTKSLYLRTFYRVWNIAIKKGYCRKGYHPKDVIELKAYKRIRTKKRAISADYFLAIEELNYEYSTRLFRSQHFFLFLYFARGVSLDRRI